MADLSASAAESAIRPLHRTPGWVRSEPPDLSVEAWPWPEPGRLALGSEAHKRLFCRTLLDTFDPYRPAVIDWPALDPEARERLASLPIWDMAIQVEDRAARRVGAYAAQLTDPLLRRAVELNAFEEGRHRLVLANLVAAYGFRLAPERPYRAPTDPEWAFMETGFGECIDSFIAFGAFEAARRSGLFPAELVATFEPVIAEEGRHILFFVNWVAWRRRTLPWPRRWLFALKVWAVWLVLGLQRAALIWAFVVDSPAKAGAHLTTAASEQLAGGVELGGILDLCLAENDRRLGKYDARLVRPRFVPKLARLARRFLLRDRPAAAVR